MKTLLSMTDFVLKELEYKKNKHYEYDSNDNDRSLDRIENYAEFLKQPLTLGMFVPCDENGNVLKYPIVKGEFVNKGFVEYQIALEKLLFKGFVQYDSYDCAIYYDGNNYLCIDDEWCEGLTIEDLILTNKNIEIELTESALKQIFG